MNYFERFEKKFFIDFNQEIQIKNKFEKLFMLEFNKGYYCYSLYFDDLNFSCLKQKQEGQTKRHKLRLRAYFNDLNDQVNSWNLEIKSKNNNTVNKKKISISNKDVIKNLAQKNYHFFSNNFKETVNTYYRPTYITFYYREAFVSKIFPYCRITFDKNIRCFKYNFDIFGNPNIDRKYILRPELILLELKYSNYLPIFISDFFQYLNLDQVTFSKYVDGYENLDSNSYYNQNYL